MAAVSLTPSVLVVISCSFWATGAAVSGSPMSTHGLLINCPALLFPFARRLVADLRRHPRRLLLTLMIGNVSINMFIFAAGLSISESLAGKRAALAPIIGLAAPVLVTLLGDIFPKGVAILLRVPLAARVQWFVKTAAAKIIPSTRLSESACDETSMAHAPQP